MWADGAAGRLRLLKSGKALAAAHSGSLGQNRELFKTFVYLFVLWLVPKILKVAQNRPSLLPKGPPLSHPTPRKLLGIARRIPGGHGRIGVGDAGPQEEAAGPRMSLPCPCSATVPGLEPCVAARIQAEDRVGGLWLGCGLPIARERASAQTICTELHGLAPAFHPPKGFHGHCPLGFTTWWGWCHSFSRIFK